MSLRIDNEMALLRQFFPDAEYQGEAHWVRLPHFALPPEPGWIGADGAPLTHAQVACQFPPGYPTSPPYGFYVSPSLALASGVAVQNVTPASEPVPWPGTWQKFSWSLPEWRPAGDVVHGSKLLDFVLTFADRLRQGA